MNHGASRNSVNATTPGGTGSLGLFLVSVDADPLIALEQAERILAAGVTVRWATADEVYGRNSEFRRFFETRDIGYVMAVGVDFRIATRTGTKRADLIARTLSPKAFNRRSCGQGARGPRVYDWAMVATGSPRHALLIRRSITNPDDIAYFYAFVPTGEPLLLSTLIRIAGIRWTVEPVLPTHGDDTPPDDYGMIALTVPEAHRLLILHDNVRDLPATTARHHTTSKPPGQPGAADTKPEPAGSTTEND